MSVVVGITSRGIIVAEVAAQETVSIMSNFFREGIEHGATAVSTGTDAQSLWQTIESSFSGDGMAATQVISSTAFGGAVSIAVVESGVGAAAIAAAAAAAGVILSPAAIATATAVAGVAAGYYAGEYFSDVFDQIAKRNAIPIVTEKRESPRIDPTCKADFNGAQKPPRRDPLTLDLDNDGLETIAASSTNPILFDHDGDGLKTGTGWVKSDDGFLVMDRNGNAAIDNGTEMFGDATSLYAGGKAADGFAALAQEDTNGDGKVNSTDAHWNQLRVWRDLNQDGISQSGELFTLNQVGIASFNVSKTANNQTLANGNQIADLGSYTRTDGTSGTMGEIGSMADVNLADDTFYREFPDQIALADGVADLPDMQGSGKVRDLHEAASQSATLKNLLAQYSQATTRQAQRALLDGLLSAWADTSGMAKTLQERGGTTNTAGSYIVSYQAFGAQKMSDYSDSSSGQLVVKPEWGNTGICQRSW